MKLNTTTAVLDEPQAAPQQVEILDQVADTVAPFDVPGEEPTSDDATALADPDQPEEDDDEEDGEHPLGVETKAEEVEITTTSESDELADPARETDIQLLARLQSEWLVENAEIEHDIARLQIEIQDTADLKKQLADECKELVDKLRERKKNGPPQHLAMHQRPLPFDQGEAKQQAEPVPQSLPTEPPELDWSLDETTDSYIAASRELADGMVPAYWRICGDDESGYRLDASHDLLLIDTGLVGVKFEKMHDACMAAAAADHKLAPQTAEAPAALQQPAADQLEDARWKQVRLEKWPKPHNLAPGTLKIFAEADLHTLGDVSAYVESGKRLIDLKGFGEGKLEKYDDCQNAFWARWKRDPEKVVREEV